MSVNTDRKLGKQGFSSRTLMMHQVGVRGGDLEFDCDLFLMGTGIGS